MAGLKKLPIEGFATAHWETARGTSEQARDYCKDPDTGDPDWPVKFIEHGKCPSQGDRSDLTPLQEVCKQIKRGTPMASIAIERPDIIVKHSRGLVFLESLVQRPYTHFDLRGLWIYGLPGVGKTRSVMEHYGRDMIFDKSQSKWWDLYSGQHVVLLDDYAKTGADLGDMFKRWADRYSCSGEIKGGTVHLRHRVFVVTSNYTPEECWDDPAIVGAINRKFLVHRMLTYPDATIPWRPLELKPDPDRVVIEID